MKIISDAHMDFVIFTSLYLTACAFPALDDDMRFCWMPGAYMHFDPKYFDWFYDGYFESGNAKEYSR
jgi:hypothetical protein